MKVKKVAVRFWTYGILCCGLLASFAHAQSRPQPSSERAAQVADALAKLRSGEFNGYHVELIGEARALEAIPDLEKQFALRPEVLDKAKIAQVLVLLGDKKDEYWNYLADLVTKNVLDSDAPSPVLYDREGKAIPGPSQEFATWAQAHHQSPGDAAATAVYILPGYVLLLGATRDARAVPLLRRALSSPNDQIASAAADGLAEMHDLNSVPLIIARCKIAPAEVAEVIAESLMYFDDPRAQDAFNTFTSPERAKILREGTKKAGPLDP